MKTGNDLLLTHVLRTIGTVQAFAALLGGLAMIGSQGLLFMLAMWVGGGLGALLMFGLARVVEMFATLCDDLAEVRAVLNQMPSVSTEPHVEEQAPKLYHVVLPDGRERGPIAAARLRKMSQDGQISSDSACRAETDAEWSTVEALIHL